MTIKQYESKVKKLANLLNSEETINLFGILGIIFQLLPLFILKKTKDFISEITMTRNDKFG